MAPRDFPAGGRIGDYAVFWLVWLAVAAAAALFVRRHRARPSRGRLVAGNALVLLALLWTVVVAAETYLRWIYDGTDSYGLTLTNHAWFSRHVRVNEDGFRDRPFDAEPAPGAVRVACVGDSFTFGYGVADAADTWPQRLGAALAARDGAAAWDVRNYGIVGVDTGAEAELVADLVARRAADRFVLGYCLNDADDLLPAALRLDRGSTPRPASFDLTRSFVADFLWYRLRLRDDARVAGYFDWVRIAYTDPAILGAQNARIRRIAETCRAAGARLDVAVFPFFQGWGDAYAFDECHARVAEAWRAAGVDVIDLRDAYRGIPGAELVAGRYDAHPNARAHTVAAETILARAFGAR